jgi:retron-type reverse transcriptase
VEPLDNQGALSDVLLNPKRERENDELTETSNLLERILAKDNMNNAMKRVINKGSHGVDGIKYDELRGFVIDNWLKIRQKLLEEKYIPSPVRRIEIPKPDGGTRLLEIPTVLDRMVQQATL